ncbi:MAG: putative signal recognition particle [Caulobacteraceae bacterium]|nr:putative signal recognition particle [Caulobacteraceae bacterium]
MSYVDGFVLAVRKDKLPAYEALARIAGAVWKEYGALSYVECIGDDVPYGELTSFPRAVQATPDEVVVFSWIVYESRERRDEIMAKVMADPRVKDHMSDMPFDGKRMIFGGFKPFLEL